MKNTYIILPLLNLEATLGIRSAKVIKEKAAELQAVIVASYGATLEEKIAHYALLDSHRDLKKQIAPIEKWEAEKKCYEVQKTTADSRAYRIKESERSDKPLYYIC